MDLEPPPGTVSRRIEIVDLYHARQHLWDLGAKLHPSDEATKRRWVMAHQHLLDDGNWLPSCEPCRSTIPS